MQMNIINKSVLAFMLLAFISVNESRAQEDVQISRKEFRHTRDGFRAAWREVDNGNAFYSLREPGGYRLALGHYLKAYEYNRENAELNYKIGACYLYSGTRSNSVSHLKKAYNANPEISSDILYLIGRGLQYSYEFDKAIEYFEKYNKQREKILADRRLRRSYDISLRDPEKRIQECKIAKTLVANPIRVFIDNVGAGINSSYPDYGPVISADESVMVFTSRRTESAGGALDPADMQYFEDLYISYYHENVGWSKAVNMKDLNSEEAHDATVAISPDGQHLYIYRGVPQGTIFESRLEGDKWSRPSSLGRSINSRYQETSGSISPCGNYFYFVSERPEDDFGNKNLGGKDIFVSELQKNGRWGKVRNLGAPVNSKYDEEGIFMHPDGRTLYFSSRREGSMGGYDIFYTEKDRDGNWSDPVNIGYPINTPEDDVFFVVSGNARYAYFSSDREGGYGLQDIYRITFLGAEKLLAYGSEDYLIASSGAAVRQKVEPEKVEVRTVRLTILKGIITDALSGEPIEAQIQIYDNEKDELISTMSSNSVTGRYLVSLPSGKNYGIHVKAEDYLFYSENFDIPEATSYQEVTNDIVLSRVGIGSRIVLRNIFFDFAKSSLRETSFPELNRLVDLMKAYPRMKIEIGGHTDNVGSHSYNKQLSEDRAKSVVNYLINNGINRDRLSYKGYAFDEPIDTNETDEGRQRNRRVEFKVISIN